MESLSRDFSKQSSKISLHVSFFLKLPLWFGVFGLGLVWVGLGFFCMMHVIRGAPAVNRQPKNHVCVTDANSFVSLRHGFNFGNISDDKCHNVNSKNLLSMTQNTLEDTVLTVKNINLAYVKREWKQKQGNTFQG